MKTRIAMYGCAPALVSLLLAFGLASCGGGGGGSASNGAAAPVMAAASGISSAGAVSVVTAK